MAATTIAAASSLISLPLRNKLLHLPSDYNQSLTSHFTSKPKPTKTLKLRSQNPHTPPFCLLFPSLLRRASSAFDDFVSEDDEPESEAEDDDYEEGEMEPVDAGRLYVGNLPFSMTASELTEIFAEAGRVVSVQIVYDRVTDRSRGFAFVTMGSVTEATEAIRMYDGSQVGGRTVKVNFPEVPRGGERDAMGPRIRFSNQGFVDSPHALYVGNLSWAITTQGLKEAFLDQPGLLSAKVIYDRDSGRSRGFGFVTFSSAEEMESAVIAMNGVELEGRPLRVNIAEDKTLTQARNSEDGFGSRDMLSSFSN